VTEYTIDPFTWCGDRELKYKPKHFVTVRTSVTIESKKWIYNKLKGRFAITFGNPTDDQLLLDFELFGFPSFEDPSEAVLYELTWS
jgi:hypothetical protein